MAKQKLEAVTATFHFLQRNKGEGSRREANPFSEAEFDALVRKIESLPPLDLGDERTANRVRFRFMAPLGPISRIDPRTAFGTFQSGYSGHSYENTVKGKIPAESISLRKFFYLLYLSDSGNIYVAAQYLGLFGGYSALQNTLRDFLGDFSNIDSHSFRLGSRAYRNARPVAVRVAVSDQSRSVAGRSSLASRTVIAFKKEHKDDGFEQEVSQRLISKMDAGQGEIRKAVAEIISESSLMSVKDTDVEDATVIAMVGKQRRTIHLIEAGDAATRFPLDVDLDGDGHPVPDQAQVAMLELLTEEIIRRRL